MDQAPHIGPRRNALYGPSQTQHPLQPPPTGLYKYTKFEDFSAQIRVLRLLPPDESGVLRCTLKAHSLEDKPFYVALSYEGGERNSRTDVEISIDGQRWFIGRDLWRFLDYIQRHRAGGLEAGDLWVDAVCIHQDDPEEKAAQVHLMGQIFGQADHVLAWLGQKTTFEVQKTFDFVRALSFHVNSDNGLEKVRFMGLIPDKYSKITHSRLKATDAWNSILHLCQLSYWTRRWIIQETIFARNLILLCDGNEITWATLQIMLEFVDKHMALPSGSIPERYHGIDVSWWRTLHALENTTVWRIYRLRSKLLTADTGPSLKTLMTVFGDTQCRLPHDRVYALLNLTRERNEIQIQYSGPVLELFEEIIGKTKDLSTHDWPKRLMKILELDTPSIPLPKPSHCPIVPMKIAARHFMCISHVFHSSSKVYLRDLTRTGRKIQEELGTKDVFKQHYRVQEFKDRRVKWRGNFLIKGSATQISELQRWSAIVSSWQGPKLDKILTIVRNIEDTCPVSISGTRLIIMNNGGLAYAVGDMQSGDIILPLARSPAALLLRFAREDALFAVGTATLGPNLGEKWTELVRNWYAALGSKTDPEIHLSREDRLQDDGSLTLFMDAACFVGMYRKTTT